MLDVMRSFCSGNRGSILLGHGQSTLPAYREHLNYRVSIQWNRVSPNRSSLEVGSREADKGDAGIGKERKRMPLCNRADRGCVD